jgi:hypothetical protein
LTAIAGDRGGVIEGIVSGVIIASRSLNTLRRLIENRLNTIKQRMPGRKKTAHIKTGIERITVKKIVIISQQGRVNHELIALLAALFPECDISIAAADKKDFGPCPVDSFPKTDMVDEPGT